jgi:hypothetical protein
MNQYNIIFLSQGIASSSILPSGKPSTVVTSNSTESNTFAKIFPFDIRINLIRKSTRGSRTCHKSRCTKTREAKRPERGSSGMTKGRGHCARRNIGRVSLRETDLAICLNVDELTSRNFNVLPVSRIARGD